MENEYRQILDDFVENQVIDVEDLDSYRLIGGTNPDWDEDEEFKTKCKQAIQQINEDGLWELTNIPDRYKREAITYIKEKGE